MSNYNHYRTVYLIKTYPFLEHFKNIFDLYFEYDMNDYLEFHGYNQNVIDSVSKHMIIFDNKSDLYKQNPLNINACYSYFSTLKINKINNIYLFNIYKKNTKKEFKLPPNSLVLCKKCNIYTYVSKCHLCTI